MLRTDTAPNLVLTSSILDKWQKLLDLIGKTFDLPATLIMKKKGHVIEVFASSEEFSNPYIRGSIEKLDGLYCETVINTRSKLLIPNALKDKRWRNNPDIKLGMIAYLGYPIFMPDGTVFGTLCVLDRKENTFSQDIENLLLQIKEIIELDVAGFLAFESKSLQLEEKVREQLQSIDDGKQVLQDLKKELNQEQTSRKELKSRLRQTELKYSTLVSKMSSAVVLFLPVYGANEELIDAIYLDMNPIHEKLIGLKKEDVVGKSVLDFFPTTDPGLFQTVQPVVKENRTVNFETFYPPVSMHFSINAFPMGDGSFCVNFFDISDQVFLKEKIETSELRYKSFFNSIEAGIVIFEPICNAKGELVDLRYVDMNPVNEKIIGAKSQDMIGKTHFEVFPETHDAFIKHFKTVVENQKGMRFENYYPFLSKYYSINVFPIDNNLIAFTCYDITESVLARQEVEASEKRHKAIFDNSSSLMVLIDPENGAILDANKAVFKYTGYSRDEFLSMDLDLISSYGKEVIKEQLRLARNENKNYFEFKHRLASGEFRDIEVYTGLIEEKGKTILHCIVHDITDKKNALKETLKLSKAVEQSPASVVITDVEGNIEYSNPTNCELTGYTFEELLGQNPRIVKSGKQSNSIYRDLWQTILAGRKWEGEIYNRKKDGSHYWESAIIAPIINNEGLTISFIKVGKDITERKKIELELRKAKSKAEESDRLKTAFLANLSHEVRTPLNGILGFTKLLTEEDISEEERRDFVNVIHESGEQLMMIINDLVKISQIEAGKMSVEMTEFFVDDLIREVVQFHRPECLKSGLLLCRETKLCKSSKCISDRQRIRQVLDNLIKNAIKYTSQGGITITTECRGMYLLFSIKDTGIGIAPEHHRIIFDRFRQVEDHYTRSYGGNGLGLSISKEIVKLLGGELWVESQLGKGSTFHFTIPLDREKLV
ncbi:MAG: PAS domain S-box protein [Marinifilaceae bacterium]